jgi:hypothetical protein
MSRYGGTEESVKGSISTVFVKADIGRKRDGETGSHDVTNLLWGLDHPGLEARADFDGDEK